jgi:hypothetical protein
MTNPEYEYRGRTPDYEVGIYRADRGRDDWVVKFWSLRGGWGRTTWTPYREGDVAEQVAHRVAAENMACPLS